MTVPRPEPQTATDLSKHQRERVRQAARNQMEIAVLSVYVLAVLVVLLVIYLFYAVINPDKL
jgi:K+-transporting ATPase KdpF subunit